MDSHASVWMFLLVCAWRFRPVQTSTATRQEKQEWDSSPVEVIAQPLAGVSLSWRRSGPVPCSVTLDLEHWPTKAHSARLSDSILKKCSHHHNVGTLRMMCSHFWRGAISRCKQFTVVDWLQFPVLLTPVDSSEAVEEEAWVEEPDRGSFISESTKVSQPDVPRR